MPGGEWITINPTDMTDSDCMRLIHIVMNAEANYAILEVMRECQVSVSLVNMSDGVMTEWILNLSDGVCAMLCPIGEKISSETDCACVAIETLPAQGMLFEAHY